MNVSAGETNVSGGINGANNTYAATGNGTLRISGANGHIGNSNVTLKRNGTTDATITRATVGTASISKAAAATQGSVANAAIEISAAAYAIDSVALSNSLITLKSAGTVTLANVVLSGTTKLAGDATATGTKAVVFSGNGNSLSMPAEATGTGLDTFDTGAATLTSVYVYDISAHFSDVTLTGHLAIDVSALLGTLPGNFDYIAFDSARTTTSCSTRASRRASRRTPTTAGSCRERYRGTSCISTRETCRNRPVRRWRRSQNR